MFVFFLIEICAIGKYIDDKTAPNINPVEFRIKSISLLCVTIPFYYCIEIYLLIELAEWCGFLASSIDLDAVTPLNCASYCVFQFVSMIAKRAKLVTPNQIPSTDICVNFFLC